MRKILAKTPVTQIHVLCRKKQKLKSNEISNDDYVAAAISIIICSQEIFHHPRFFVSVHSRQFLFLFSIRSGTNWRSDTSRRSIYHETVTLLP